MQRRILHLLTRKDERLPAEIIEQQRLLLDGEVKVVDLTLTTCDYQAVLDDIFAADSIQVW